MSLAIRLPILLISLLIPLGYSAGQEPKPEIRAKLEGHRGGVTAIVFAPKRPILATGSGSGTILIWDAKTGAKLAVVNATNGERITGLAFSMDGNKLASSAHRACLVFDVTDPKNPKIVNSTPFPRSHDVALSGDGSQSYHIDGVDPKFKGRGGYVVRRGGGSASAWTEPRPLDPRALAGLPDPDARVVAAYGLQGAKAVPAVILYGLGDPKIHTQGVPVPAKDAPSRLFFAPDARWLGLCSGTLHVWKMPGGLEIKGDPITFPGPVYAGALGPNDVAATIPPPDADNPTIVTFWKLGDKAEKQTTIATGVKDMRCLALSADGRTLAVGGLTDGLVQLWTLRGEK